MPRSGNPSMRAFACAVGTSLTTLLLVACGHEPAPQPSERPHPVRIATVERADTSNAVVVSGLVASRSERRLAFKAAGVVASVNVNEGMAVKQGDLLAELAPDEVESLQTQALEAEHKAARDLERARNLHERGLLSLQQVQDAESAFASAAAQARAARFTRDHARILAPADGLVLRRLAEPGETVSAGTPVLVMAAGNSGWVLRAGVPDRQALRLRVGDRADVSVDAWPGRIFSGRVQELAAASDAGTGTLSVEIAFGSGGLKLLSGLVGSARVDASVPARPGTAEALAIPVGALLEAEGNAAHVYLLDASNGTARRTDITTDGIDGSVVIVSGGLRRGDKVISEGAAWLRDGSPVDVIP